MDRLFNSAPLLHFARYNEKRSSRATKQLHNHPQWQVELIVKGTPTLLLEDEQLALNPGDMVLLPPEAWHGFNYNDALCAWYTTRFSLENSARLCPLVTTDGQNTHFFKSLTDLIGSGNKQLEPHVRESAEHCMAGLLVYNYGKRQQSPSSSFVQKVNDYLSQHCDGPMSVGEVAQCAGYSASHTRALYKKQTGRSLKHAIDQARFDEAFQYLIHSDHTITEIADELAFPDVFSFSRFVRRMAGVSPKGIRFERLSRRNKPH